MQDKTTVLTHTSEVDAVKVSVIVLTYRQAEVVQACLASFFAQTLSSFQLVVSDDASPDETWSVIETVCQTAPPGIRLSLNRNPRNLGIVGNYNRALALCDGDVIFSAAGDDVSLPHRLHRCVERWLETGQRFDLVATDLVDMAYDGERLGDKPIDTLEHWDWQRWMRERPYHAGASHMVTRRLVELAPMREDAMLEDQCLFFRALLMGGALRVAEPLVLHRRGGVSTQPSPRNYDGKRADILKSARQSMAEFNQYLQDAQRLNAPESLKDFLRRQIDTTAFIQACLGAQGRSESLACLWQYPQVAWRKKLRYGLFVVLSGLYRLGYAIKRFLKGN